ncbi:bifunctional phosphopantothenoylcysteine decarboxylase/phosphopantothenate--cysteine ligase CoaBC [Faecalicoccus pleomorphus]|uniref:bifunctional phosphopantothenoylcysteine decarboxylase/phosphopantothenate--cysteine ligase CoaBC n=1 Tax=Faecalicoccus pleomorphus TaxID=1323 RepID=UPI00242BED2D|nr:bifunctional phosphopantothenoylcysteine decarboxylase/phosphopantothenate--cysteine ligase CoaBC [Faecalicoccus pleomorphus]
MKKHILIGVTGGIAAYKACDLVSQLKKQDMEVRVMMTSHAAEFVSPLTFTTLSSHPCEVDLFDPANPDPIAHISLAKWADLVLLIPCTANVLAKVVHGISDDLVTTTFLACTCPKWIAPAMNVHMYENPVTQNNLKLARELGYQIIEPVVGHLACDDTGKGKLADIYTVRDMIVRSFQQEKTLSNKKVLITAGPTQEAIDPVRFISNHSSGKQGYAIAKAAKELGADVTLVSGPVSLPSVDGVHTIPVTTALDMFEVMKEESQKADYIVMAAAVADYRPAKVASDKIKKTKEETQIDMVPNPDILEWIGQHKRENQIICGFAMETKDLDKNAQEKCIRKNCDLLIANNLKVEGAGFQTDTNVVTLVSKNTLKHLPKCTKEELGFLILRTMKEIEEGKSLC